MSRVVKRRKRRKDYQSKNFNNPFYKKRKKQGRVRTSKKSIFYTIVILIVLAFAFWFFYVSNTFKIKNISINGLNRVDNDIVLTKVNKFTEKKKLFFSQDNLFLLNSNKLRESLLNEFNFLEVEVNKELSNKLIVNITERPYEAIFYENDSYYYIDSQGVVVDKINSLDKVNPRKYAIINNESNNYIEDDKLSIKIDSLSFILSFWDKLRQDSSIIIEKFIIKNIDSSLSAQVIDGPILYLNLENNPIEQAENLIILKNNDLEEDFLNRSYIDLRYGDRLFLD